MAKTKDDWDNYGKVLSKIRERIDEKLGSSRYVAYSAYEIDEEKDIPVDNLDKIAVEGKVKFVNERDEFWGGQESKDWESEILINPTWLDVCVLANEMIQTTKDFHHVFLEGINVLKREEDLNIAELMMGS